MTILFFVSLLMGMIPILLAKCFKWKIDSRNNIVIRSLLFFGGGVLFCTTFVHLLPEVKDAITEAQKNNSSPVYDLPLAEIIMCFGFLLIYIIEEIVHCIIHVQKNNIVTDINMEGLSRKENIGSHSGHDHEIIIDNFRGLMIVLALSIHELFEGLAVGLEKSVVRVWLLLIAISSHKFIIAFCLGLKLVVTKISTKSVLFYIFIFAFVSPLGIGTGLIMTNTTLFGFSDITKALLQGTATGTLLYVVVFEILQKNSKDGLWTCFTFLIGFLLTLSLQLITGHQHSHEHSHYHQHDHFTQNTTNFNSTN